MTNEDIVNEFNHGHSKEWLINKQYESLQWEKRNKEDSIYKGWYAPALRWEAKRQVEDALYKNYMKEVLNKR